MQSESKKLRADLDQAEAMLREFLSCEYESKRDLNDCIDNLGKPYQSQYLYDLIAKAEAFLSRPEAPQPEAKEAQS